MNKTSLSLAVALALVATSAGSGTYFPPNGGPPTVCQGSTCIPNGDDGDDGGNGGAGGNASVVNEPVFNNNPNIKPTFNNKPVLNNDPTFNNNPTLNIYTGQGEGEGRGGDTVSGGSSSSRADANADANATGGNASATGGTGGSASAQGTVNTNVNVDSSGDYKDTYRKYTPSAGAYAASPTAPCIVTFGAGVGIPGFSGSYSGAVEDEECTFRETVRLGLATGDAKVQAVANLLMYNRLVRYWKEDQEAIRAEESADTAATPHHLFEIGN